MKNVALHNLGCKVNSYELEVMQQMLIEKGYNIVPFYEIADVYIVNTCTVTNIADRKSRQMLHRAKQKNPDAIVVAVGCYVQTGRDKVEKDECIDLAIGNNQKGRIAEIITEYIESKSHENAYENIPDINHTAEYEDMTLKQTAEHTRAYIKIQDGCNQFCSYCAIPLARGRVRSRLSEDILEEIRGIAASGYKEIVLTGIHISSYGIDFDDDEWNNGNSKIMFIHDEDKVRRRYTGFPKLIDLLEKINEIEGIERIRLGSLEPRIVTDENAERLSKIDKLCPHFHLSLQSGCDETLKRMNRRYTSLEYLDSVNYLRKYFDRPAITTDVIVGFPGETEEEFEQTKEFLELVKFYEMHIFKYSKRTDTKAAVMPNQVSDQIKTLRSNELLEMEKRLSEEFRIQHLGEDVDILLEEKKNIDGKDFFIGHTKDYVKVAVEDVDGRYSSNETIKVKLESLLKTDILLGRNKED